VHSSPLFSVAELVPPQIVQTMMQYLRFC